MRGGVLIRVNGIIAIQYNEITQFAFSMIMFLNHELLRLIIAPKNTTKTIKEKN